MTGVDHEVLVAMLDRLKLAEFLLAECGWIR